MSLENYKNLSFEIPNFTNFLFLSTSLGNSVMSTPRVTTVDNGSRTPVKFKPMPLALVAKI